ncbi:hypothetical protein BSKO_08498 [Bryopsis sp. KO-2023]|nr:hypothetical protein BSKO_08498 [Bryopsis sp. KO-2023]
MALAWKFYALVALLLVPLALPAQAARVLTDDDLALIAAAKDGDLKAVRSLNKKGARINIKDDTGTTPLGWASFNGHEDVVFFLLKEGALVNAADYEGFTPLDSAAEKGFVKIARALIEDGAPVNTRNHEGRTPLYAAASGGHLALVRLLVSAGADIETRYPPTDGTPFLVASELGFTKIVSYLLGRGAKSDVVDRFGSFALYLASQNGHAEVVEIILDIKDIDPDKAGPGTTTPVIIAAQNGHSEVVKALLDADADPTKANLFGDTALHKAPTIFDLPELMEMLLDAGADIDAPDNRDDTPLHMAAQFGAKKSVEVLVKAGADVELPNNSFLLPEDVVCQCIEFKKFPDSLQCPVGSCSEEDINEITALLKGDDGGLTISTAPAPETI